VKISSSNVASARAVPGDDISVEVTASEELFDFKVRFTSRTPRILATGSSLSVDGKTWKATYEAAALDEADGAAITFTLTARDLAGNSVTSSASSDNSKVVFSTFSLWIARFFHSLGVACYVALIICPRVA